MISVTQIGWGKYRDFEGPYFIGSVKVPDAPRTASFAERVLSLTAAAEGGNFDSINMYDSGLVSVGAIQFTDSASFQVTDLIGAVADELGPDYILDTLKPALDMCNASFSKTESGYWRFTLNGTTVKSKELQKLLYFGDAQGNALSSFNNAKKLRAKTWATCLANVWRDPKAVAVQCNFTLPRLINNFVWGQLKQDLFVGDQPEDGWLAATRALLLSFAVNSPTTVVKRYATHRNNKNSFGTPEWCLAVLRGVITNGLDVWPARWRNKTVHVKRMFGVTLPSYEQLVSGKWSPPAPADEIEKPILVTPVVEIVGEPIIAPIQDVTPLPIITQPQSSGVFTSVIQLIKMVLEVIVNVFRKSAP